MALSKLTDIRKSLSVEVEDLQVNGITTFTGSVSIGGTLTYEDVTNIDSVGIITAQSGIHVTGGSVGIGTSNPASKLEVNAASTPHITSVLGQSDHITMTTGTTGGGFHVTTGNHFAINHQPFANIGGNSNLTERLRITPNGQLVIGHNASHGIDIGHEFRVQVSGTDFPTSGISQQRFENNVSGATLALGHSRNGTQGSHTILQVGDEYGKIRFYGSDGTDFDGYGAAIVAKVETGVAVNRTPGHLEFHTTASDSNNAIERFRITHEGKIGIGITNPAALTHIYDSTDTSSSTEQFRISGGDRTADTFETGFRFFTQSPSANGNRHVRFTSNGNVGLEIQPIETSSGNAAVDRNILLCPSGGSVRVGNNNSFSAHTAADDLVVGATSGSNGMTILTGSATGNIFFNDGSGNDGVIQYVHSTTPNYMRIASSGWIRLSAGGNNHGGGIFCREKTCTTSGTNIFSFSCTHGALAGTLYAICSNNGFSVSKIYQFCGKHGGSTFTLVADSGAYAGKNFSVTRTASGNVHTFSCTTSGANAEISFTFHMGAPNQDVTYTEL